MANARLEAARNLCAVETKNTTAKEEWRASRGGAETALVLGTLRRRATLDAVLSTYATRPLAIMRPVTRAVLRSALFEHLFMDRSPNHAIINDAVENIRALGRPKDASFVNAMLRGINRAVSKVDRSEATDLRRALPREEFSWYFPRSVFPDRNHSEAAFLAARASTPLWIAKRRLAELDFHDALACLDAQAEVPQTFLRPTDKEAVRAKLLEADIPVTDGPHDAILALPPQVRVGMVFDLCGDQIVVQDSVASQVAPFLAEGITSGTAWKVLDYCAAPGGKATHLAQLGADVTAWDIAPDRLAIVVENAERLGLKNLRTGEPEGEYDAVLVDAPCSNTGVLARRPEARWRIKERHLKNMIERQRSILKAAAPSVRPGGVLVYSTCSLEPDENRQVAESLGWEIEADKTCYPHKCSGDGGYMARLRKPG